MTLRKFLTAAVLVVMVSAVAACSTTTRSYYPEGESYADHIMSYYKEEYLYGPHTP